MPQRDGRLIVQQLTIDVYAEIGSKWATSISVSNDVIYQGLSWIGRANPVLECFLSNECKVITDTYICTNWTKTASHLCLRCFFFWHTDFTFAQLGWWDSPLSCRFFRHRTNYNQMLFLPSPMTYIGFQTRTCKLQAQYSTYLYYSDWNSKSSTLARAVIRDIKLASANWEYVNLALTGIAPTLRSIKKWIFYT